MPTIFSPEQIDSMCRQVGTTRIALLDALTRVGPAALPQKQRERWRPDVPSSQFCYRVSEAVVRSHRVPDGYRLYRKADDMGSHYFFLNTATGEILDLTADQFVAPDGTLIGYDYSGGVPRTLLPQVSRGAQMVATALGWTFEPSKGSDARR